MDFLLQPTALYVNRWFRCEINITSNGTQRQHILIELPSCLFSFFAMFMMIWWKKCTNETDGRVKHLHGFPTRVFGRENATGKMLFVPRLGSATKNFCFANMQLRPGSLPSFLEGFPSRGTWLRSLHQLLVHIASLTVNSYVEHFRSGNVSVIEGLKHLSRDFNCSFSYHKRLQGRNWQKFFCLTYGNVKSLKFCFSHHFIQVVET